MRVKMFPLSGGLGGMAFDITDLENARETLDKHAKAHDDTLNHVADGVAIFGQDRKLIFNNRAFAEMWALDPAYLLEKPDHGSLLDRLRERRKLPARGDYATLAQGRAGLLPGREERQCWRISGTCPTDASSG